MRRALPGIAQQLDIGLGDSDVFVAKQFLNALIGTLEWALSTLREDACACDVPTLDLMLAGMASRDLAVCRGVTLRAVRSSQARLRALASQAGKYCW